MKKLATLHYDVTDLVTAGEIQYLIKVTAGQDELIKNAHVPSLEEAEEIPDDQFALVLYHPHIGKMKKLAMTDKYLTEINMRIFEDRMNSLPEAVVKVAAYNLCKAGKFFGINVPDSLLKYASEAPLSNFVNISEIKSTMVKKASEPTTYALNGKYPLNTAGLVKKAMSYFSDHWKRFSPLNAYEYAVNVKTAADKLGVDYSGTLIDKYASIDTTSLSKNFRSAVSARKGYVLEEQRGVFDDLIKQASSLGPTKTAQVLETLDRELGLHRQWNKSIEDPIFSVFDVKREKFVKTASYKIGSADLQRLPEGIVDSATLAELKGPEGMDVFESLPSPVRTKLAKALTK